MSILQVRNVPHRKLGIVTDDDLRIRVDHENLRWPVVDLYDGWWNAIRRAVESESSSERIPSL
jgi:hypothetical protein